MLLLLVLTGLWFTRQGARVSIRRKKSRAVHQAPEDHSRVHISGRERYRSPPRESHPYDDVMVVRLGYLYDDILHNPVRINTWRRESHPYDDILHNPVRINTWRRESHPYDDVLASPMQRNMDHPYDEVFALRARNDAHCSRYSDYERQGRERTMHYREYYNLNWARETNGAFQAHSRASHFQAQDHSDYVQPNVIPEWRLAAFRAELAKERLEIRRKNSRQIALRKYTFQTRFGKT